MAYPDGMSGRATGRGWTEWIAMEVFLRKSMLDDVLDNMVRKLGVKDDAVPLGSILYPPVKPPVDGGVWIEFVKRWKEGKRNGEKLQ